MATLSTSDRAWVRLNTGTTDDLTRTDGEKVFTDAELDDLYTRANENLDRTVLAMWIALAADQSKQANYKAGQTSEDAGDIFQHCLDMIALWRDLVATSGSNGQVRILGLRPVPTVHREMPATLYDPDLPKRLNGTRWRR